MPLALGARVVLGIGDALTFISVMRLVPSWFPPERSGRITTATGPLNQLGFVVSAVAFVAVLAALGWTPSFLLAALISVLTGGLVLALLKDSPYPRPPRVPLGHALAVAGRSLREAWAAPGTRLAFWLNFTTLFPGMAFGVMWGYPFLTVGQELSPAVAGAMMTVLAMAGIGYGVTLGSVMSRYPFYRSLISLSFVALTMVVWGVVLLWPGRARVWLLAVLVLVISTTGMAAFMSCEFARTFNPLSRLGSAIGVVNVGGFAGTLLAVMVIGVVLESASSAPAPDYTLSAFKAAFATQYLLWALGIVQLLRYRRRTLRFIEKRDPAAYAALRRGVLLPPPG